MNNKFIIQLIRFLTLLCGLGLILLLIFTLFQNISKTEFDEFDFYSTIKLDSELIYTSIICLSITYSVLVIVLFFGNYRSFEFNKIKYLIIKIFAIVTSLALITYGYDKIPSIIRKDVYLGVLASTLFDASGSISSDLQYGDYLSVQKKFINNKFDVGPVTLFINDSGNINELAKQNKSYTKGLEFQVSNSSPAIITSGSSGLSLLGKDLSDYPLWVNGTANSKSDFKATVSKSSLGDIDDESKIYFTTDFRLIDSPPEVEDMCITVIIRSLDHSINPISRNGCLGINDYANSMSSIENQSNLKPKEKLGNISLEIPSNYNDFDIFVTVNPILSNYEDYEKLWNNPESLSWTIGNSNIRINNFGSVSNIQSYCLQGYHNANPSKFMHIITDNLSAENFNNQMGMGKCP